MELVPRLLGVVAASPPRLDAPLTSEVRVVPLWEHIVRHALRHVHKRRQRRQALQIAHHAQSSARTLFQRWQT
eukprot:3155684-Pleurochrysis_carterae.AAC.1